MRVDVITAVHAPHARFLPAAWASLVAQRHRDWRWLVQVDGRHLPVVLALDLCGAARDPRVSIEVTGSREGPATTRNIALGRSSAALVQNLDADDELEPDALVLLATALDTDRSVGYATGRARDLLDDGTLLSSPAGPPAGRLERCAMPDQWVTEPGRYRLPVHPAGLLWRRSLLVAVGGWSALRGMEDTGLLMAASALAPGMQIDAPTLRYRRHPEQRSANPTGFGRGGGGAQIALVLSRVDMLAAGPAWSSSW